MVREHSAGCIDATVEMLAENHLVAAWQYGEGAQVKNLMVQRTQGDSVGYDIRPLRLKPFDVRCFKPDGLAAEAEIMTAYAATKLVGKKNLLTECGIAAADLFLYRSDVGQIVWQTDCGKDVGAY